MSKQLDKDLKEQEQVDSGIKRSAMAIRQELMAYFKGDCVEYYDFNVAVSTTRMGREGDNRWIDRHLADRNDKRKLVFHRTVIGWIEKEPEKITFRKNVLTRSPEFKMLYGELTDFMGKYLGGVIVEEDKAKTPSDGTDDRSLMLRLAEGDVQPNTRRSFSYSDVPDFANFVQLQTRMQREVLGRPRPSVVDPWSAGVQSQYITFYDEASNL